MSKRVNPDPELIDDMRRALRRRCAGLTGEDRMAMVALELMLAQCTGLGMVQIHSLRTPTKVAGREIEWAYFDWRFAGGQFRILTRDMARKHYLNDLIYTRIQTKHASRRTDLDRALKEKASTVAAMEKRLQKHATLNEFISTLTLQRRTKEGFRILDDIRRAIEDFLADPHDLHVEAAI